MSRYLRQMDLVPLERLRDLQVTIIGCGAIGSFVAVALGKMGVGRMLLYDADVVNEVNLGTQFFCNTDIGTPKVTALATQLAMLTEAEVIPHAEAYDGQPLEGIVVSAVDTMTARRRIWRHVRGRRVVPIYVDSRMGAMVGQVLTVHPGSPIEEQAYRRTLCSEQEALREPCTARSIIHTVLGISSIVAGLVRDHVVGEAIPREIVQDYRLGALLVDGRAVA